VAQHRPQNRPQHVIGIDFGTLSGRTVVVAASDGEELGMGEFHYPHGVMDPELAQTGERLPAAWALQDPQDYAEVLRHAVPAALEDSGVDPESVVGVGTDFTSCTIMPTLRDGTPLCRLDDLSGRPHAHPKLWRHHAAQPQADRVTEVAARRGEPWLDRYGGRISSQWAIAKALQVLEEDPELYDRMERWVEAGDWIAWQLCGEEVRKPVPPVTRRCIRMGHIRLRPTSLRWTSALPTSPPSGWRSRRPSSALARAR